MVSGDVPDFIHDLVGLGAAGRHPGPCHAECQAPGLELPPSRRRKTRALEFCQGKSTGREMVMNMQQSDEPSHMHERGLRLLAEEEFNEKWLMRDSLRLSSLQIPFLYLKTLMVPLRSLFSGLDKPAFAHVMGFLAGSLANCMPLGFGAAVTVHSLIVWAQNWSQK